jgi:hypothetical protein
MKLPLLKRKPVSKAAGPDKTASPAPAPAQPARAGSFKQGYAGWVRVDGDHVLRGWAIDRNARSGRLAVDIQIEGETVATVLANRLDPKLIDLGEGDGHHAFAVVIPESFRDGRPHSFGARTRDGGFALKQKAEAFEVQAKAKGPRIDIGAAGRGMATGRLHNGHPDRLAELELWRDGQRLEAPTETKWFGASSTGDFVFSFPPELADQGGELILAAPGMVEGGYGGAVLGGAVMSAAAARRSGVAEPVPLRRGPRPVSETDVRVAYELFVDRLAVSAETMDQRVGMDAGRFISSLVTQKRFKAQVIDRLNAGAATLGGAMMRMVRASTITRLADMLGLPQLPRLYETADVPWDEFFQRLLAWPDFLEALTEPAREAVRLRPQALLPTSCVVGAIDGCFGNEVSGWAFDRNNPDGPLWVEILGDAVLLGSAACDLARPDVVGPLAEGRSVGFSFSLPADTAWLVGAERFHLSVRDLITKRIVAPPIIVDLAAAPTQGVLQALRRRLDAMASELEAVARLLPRVAREASVPLGRYAESKDAWLSIGPGETIALREAGAAFGYRPRFSIVVAANSLDDPGLRASLQSLKAQIYDDWDVVIAVRGVDPRSGRAFLVEAAGVPVDRAGAAETEAASLAGLQAAGLAIAPGDYAGILIAGDSLAPDALHQFAASQQNRRHALLYADGDVVSDGVLTPIFRPELDRDLLAQQDYIGFFLVDAAVRARVGPFSESLDGAHLHDFLLRAIEGLDDAAVWRCPRVLHHTRVDPALGADVATLEDRRARAIQAHLERTGAQAARARPGDATSLPRIDWIVGDVLPDVSLIVIAGPGAANLNTCLTSVLASLPAYGGSAQLIVVHDGSASHEALAPLAAAEGVQILERPGATVAAMRNAGAQAAEGEILVFLGEETVVSAPGWVRELATQAMRPEVGAAGAKLIRQNGAVRHAGIVGGGSGDIQDDGQGRHGADAGYLGRLALVHGALSVSAACMAVRATLFNALGGFDGETHGPAYADVDLCLRLREAGYRVITTPHAAMYVLGSVAGERRAAPHRSFLKAWGGAVLADPFYNPNFDRTALPFTRIRPAP